MSFRDFFTNLQAGSYSVPSSQRTDESGRNIAFCKQVMFSDEDAAKVNTLAEFDANVSKLKDIRIRRVTGGGSFSSGTKAKFKLSLPIKAKYVTELIQTNTPQERLVGFPWRWETGPSTTTTTPVFEEITISMLTMYHPSPLRIENVQHDAVLSLNDPSDPTAKTVILIPLKSSNTGDESTDFFNKIANKLTTIVSPDPVTGLYPEINIPTGNNWNIKSVFWLDRTPSADNISKVTDAFYTWMGAGSYNMVETSRSSTEIRYGWQPDGAQVRYFMLQTPVSINSTDLTYLTGSLPPTPAEEAIHKIPDPTIAGNSKVLYKKATGNAASAGCPRIPGSPVIERMSNQGMGDVVSSLFTGEVTDLLVDERGEPLVDIDTCDPFKSNAKNAMSKGALITPTKAAAWFFNFMIIIALAIGAWLGMFLITNYDYDKKYQSFAVDAGKVVGTLAKQTSNRIEVGAYGIGRALPNPFKKAAEPVPAA
jgi:hypothetical protein